MLPVYGGKIVAGKQAPAILGQTLGGLGVFCPVPGEEALEGALGGVPIRGLPDLVPCRLGLRLNPSREFIEPVGGFVHPAALVAGAREDLGECCPQAQRPVADGQLRGNLKAVILEPE